MRAAAALEGIEGSTSFDEGWSQWEHFDDVVTDEKAEPSATTSGVAVEEGKERPPIDFVILESSLPPQLHPAVSMGMRRMSSCYFSICSNNNNNNTTSNGSQQSSVADLLSLLEDTSQHQPNCCSDSIGTEQQQHQPQSTSDLLYHDILMNVFTFLDAKSLAAFSETARRPNFEVFYFLQLQLQRAILPGNRIEQRNSSTSASSSSSSLSTPLPDPLSSIAGVGAMCRLSSLNRAQAEQGVQDFLDSNSTLRTMPLSHSLAYIRQLLRRHGMFEESSSTSSNSKTSPQAMASAALFVAVVGAASFMSSDNASMMATSMNDFSFGTELPNMLFRVGFVGSLMRAAKTMSEGDATMRERAETVARTMQHMSHQLMRQMRGEGIESGSNSSTGCSRSNTNVDEAKETSKNGCDMNDESSPPLQVIKNKSEISPQQSPNPYEHLNDDKEQKVQKDTKMPSGCVGAYSRVVARASENVTSILKERRRQNFFNIETDEQRQVSSTFIDACCSDEMLHIVKDIVQVREIIDVEGMYCGSDGTETCALHTRYV